MQIDPQMLNFLVVGVFVSGLGTILALVVQVMHVWKLSRNDPQKREVRMSDEYATKGEVKDLKVHVERVETSTEMLRRELRTEISAVNSNAEARAADIHSRINDLGASITSDLGHLNGQMEIVVKGMTK